jgi:hypothetical protein
MNHDGHSSAGRHSSASRKLSREEARTLIEAQLTRHGAGILQTLSRYRLQEAVRNWHGTIRAIEEFINLPLFGIKDQNLRAWLCSIPLDDRSWSNPPAVTLAVRKEPSPHFEPGVIERYLLTMMLTAAIATGFEASGPGCIWDRYNARHGGSSRRLLPVASSPSGLSALHHGILPTLLLSALRRPLNISYDWS